jgi:hypothetical protein
MIIAHNKQNVGPVRRERRTAKRGKPSNRNNALKNLAHHSKKLATKSHKESQKTFCDFL